MMSLQYCMVVCHNIFIGCLIVRTHYIIVLYFLVCIQNLCKTISCPPVTAITLLKKLHDFLLYMYNKVGSFPYWNDLITHVYYMVDKWLVADCYALSVSINMQTMYTSTRNCRLWNQNSGAAPGGFWGFWKLVKFRLNIAVSHSVFKIVWQTMRLWIMHFMCFISDTNIVWRRTASLIGGVDLFGLHESPKM